MSSVVVNVPQTQCAMKNARRSDKRRAKREEFERHTAYIDGLYDFMVAEAKAREDDRKAVENLYKAATAIGVSPQQYRQKYPLFTAAVTAFESKWKCPIY